MDKHASKPMPLTMDEMFPVSQPSIMTRPLGGAGLPLPPVVPAIPLKNQYTPQIGLNVGMDRHHGR